MSSTSLRLRLILAFLAVVSLILFVGVASYTINQQVRTQVAELRSSDVFDLRSVDLQHVGLEIEGYWNPSGSFVATDVELVPGSSRPKLRGVIQGLDANERTITLYGVPIRILDDTESGDAEGEPVRLEELNPGQRVEVTCTVENGRWEASKVYLRNVKSSDKIKGTATATDLDGELPETVEIHGLLILVEPATAGGPESALAHMEKATHMILTLQECRAAAFELAGRTRHPAVEGDMESDRDAGSSASAADRLAQAAAEFCHILQQSLGGEDALSLPSPALLSSLRPLSKKQPPLDEQAATLRALASSDQPRAKAQLDNEFDPFLQEELMPLVYAYLSQAEEDLGDQLRGLLARTGTTTRLALATSMFAVIMAVVLGLLVSRSIHRPIRALHAAALRLGQGHLDTRIELASRDEIGVLAEAFNKMASQLATTTVSVENLERVFDSMAAALILFDPEGRITNVNRAALGFVGRGRQELIGRTFDVICKLEKGERANPVVQPRADGTFASVEKTFVRKDGSEFPVSFSGSELRSPGGVLQGYVCVAQDLAQQKRIEARIRESLAEKELLLREVHHRVKNNMQVISSLLAMQSSTDDPQLIRNLEESQSRIRTIALIHEQLYQSSELAHIDIRAYLEVLTTHLLQSFGKDDTVQVILQVDDLALDIDQSIACGLIVNELVTNSLKHAFPNERKGMIRVALREEGDGNRILSVADDGGGIPAVEPGRSNTLGLSLVSTIARQLRGRVDLSGEQGTIVLIVFPRRSSLEAVAS